MQDKQLNLNLNRGNWGGRRIGSGRKKVRSSGVAHRSRPKISLKTPFHINFKYRAHIRNKLCLRLLKKAILNARSHGLKVIHFSLQSNHVHLIVESESTAILTMGMRSLTVTFAKGLKKGRVKLERYHLHVLKTLMKTKNAVHYVLFNKQKHEKGIYSSIDEYSSLLSVSYGMDLIKYFAKKNKLTLKIVPGESWKSDDPRSFLLLKAVSEKFTSA